MSKASTQTPTSTIAADTAAIMPKPRTDRQIWGIYFALCIASVIELYSASSHEVTSANIFAPIIRHVALLGIGLVIMLALQRTHYKRFFTWTLYFTIISILCMVYTMINGDYINGARRSFSLGPLSVQPAEMVKLSAVLFIARILSTSQIKGKNDVTTRGVTVVGVAVIMLGGLLITQGLTNTILLMAISLSMMIVGGVGVRKLMLVLFIYGAIAGVFFMGKQLLDSSKKEVQVENTVQINGTDVKLSSSSKQDKKVDRSNTWKQRLDRHFKSDKYNDPITDENQQEQYSFLAQANGGLLGVGLGNSRETSRLPLAFSDYIYAIILEEGGIVGGLIVLVLYLWLLGRAGVVAARCRTAFPALLVTGMAVFIAYQALFHMAIVTGVFPVSGQPLPLISKGGMSILITSVALGIMLSVSRFAARKGEKEAIKEELRSLPENVSAENPT